MALPRDEERVRLFVVASTVIASRILINLAHVAAFRQYREHSTVHAARFGESMFSETDLDQRQQIKCALEPNSLLNSGKVFPTLQRCAELGGMHISGGKMPFPDVPRF